MKENENLWYSISYNNALKSTDLQGFLVIQILEDERGYTVHCVFDVVLIMYKTQGYTDILCNIHIHDVAYSVSYIRSTVKAEVSKDIFKGATFANLWGEIFV